MNDVSVPQALAGEAVPEGFAPLPFGPDGSFIHVNGPLYGRRDGDDLVMGFRVEPRHCNPANVCHGGMLMSVADMLLGAGSNFRSQLSRFLPTVNMTADFLAPAPLGAWVEGRADVLRITRNLVFAQCLLTADGAPALRASGVLKIGRALGDGFDLRQALAPILG
ncbi:MAG TPA: PaaI family thioesterase [Candidatus Cybelea sp.]|nr:PaaI family thioesterase [Candidatus Cybelea sp.]